LSSTAKKKGVNILVEVEDKDMIYADKDTINTVIRNLLSNAIKYTQKDGMITITSVNLKDRVQISISDTGIGISLENMEKVFMIEHTISTLGTDNEKGTGLGLMLCKDFIEKHNGKIWIESEVGKGSVFHFTLPQKKENKQS
jgi:signal transduction histidine kinase